MAAKEDYSLSGWLQRVRQTGEFSDVIVEVDGQEFNLHMLPLLNASSYFRTLPSSSNGFHSDSPRRVILQDLVGGAKGFSVAADFCYLIKPNYTLQNVAQIRAVAEYLGMAELLDSTKKFLYLNIFSHWRASVAFLLQYKPLGSPVDEYVASRCLKVISAACVKAFFDTKYLSAPIPLNNGGSPNTWQSSPCQMLTDILVRTCSLQDEYVAHVIEELVSAEVNLNLKCRQGRNVKGWLESTISVECRSQRARCWAVICLTRMLEKSVTSDRPWLELSSQYWCSLLQHVGSCLKMADSEMKERLDPINEFLEERIGGSLHELDEYLLNYTFEPQVLLSLVTHFRKVEGLSEKEMEEVAIEVDSCLWNFVDNAQCVPASDFIYLIESFPAKARNSHDMLYAAIEKLLAKGEFSSEEKQDLWRLVDVRKLSQPYNDKALNNSVLLCQPQVLEYVLQQHSQELEAIGSEDRQNLRSIMQKVVKASLKLLEENSRRSMEITELQKQYSELLGSKGSSLRYSCESSPDACKSEINLEHDEVEELPSEVPARGSTCSSGEL